MQLIFLPQQIINKLIINRLELNIEHYKINIKNLIGVRFNSIFRCADMLCLNLGKDIFFDNKPRPEFSFHVQTPWRFVKNNVVLLASRDIYLPKNPNLNNPNWNYDIVDRAEEESSIFDAAQKTFFRNFSNALVKKVEVDDFGDLEIFFSNDVKFETFTPCSIKAEFWRFINFSTGQHNIIFEI